MPQLFPYQITGARFLAQRRRAMLLDEQGLGKTAQAIAAANAVRARRVLIACPASVRSAWTQDLATFGAAFDATIESYDKIAKDWRIYDGPWDVVIMDEAQYLKSPSAARTLALYGGVEMRPGIVPVAAYAWGLTGTPAPNHAAEMHTHMAALAPQSLSNPMRDGRPYDRLEFEGRFAIKKTTRYGTSLIGTKNHEDLRARLAPWTLRRTKKEVLPDLPDIQYQPLLFDVADANKALAGVPGEDMALLRDVLKDGDAANLRQIATHLATLRRVTALAKTELVINWIEEFFQQSDRKLVLFGQHTEPLDRVFNVFRKRWGDYRSPMILGRTPKHARAKAIEKFQNDPKARLFLGQIQAAGTGITLTAASDLLFLEQSWSPAENAQAAMRIHRIGQKRGCMVRYACLAGSIDEAVQNTLARKTKDLEKIFG